MCVCDGCDISGGRVLHGVLLLAEHAGVGGACYYVGSCSDPRPQPSTHCVLQVENVVATKTRKYVYSTY